MSEVYFSFSHKDNDIAKSIIEAMQDAGLDVFTDRFYSPSEIIADRMRGEIVKAQCVVVLWSAAAASSEWVRREIPEIIKAWSNNRLLLVALDGTELPVGLRDLPVIALKSDSQRSNPAELVEHAKSIIQGEKPELESPHFKARETLRPLRRRRLIWTFAAIVCVILALIGFSQITPKLSSTFEQVSSDFRSELRDSAAPNFSVVYLITLGALIGAACVWLWPKSLSVRSDHSAPERKSAISEEATSAPDLGQVDLGHQVFVSYSHRDGPTVEQLVKDIEQAGYKVWIDRQSPMAWRYAAPIVRAIKASRVVALMCSEHSFASDHVIREVYVAGDYKKPFIAFQLDQSEFPDEVLYFVTGFPRIPLGEFDSQQLRSELSRLIAA